MIIQIQCPSCGGTGLYSGFAEPKGTAVICLECNGSGCKDFKYTPFTGRKHKPGVYTIQRSRGSLLALGVGAVGKTMTYDEFQSTVK